MFNRAIRAFKAWQYRGGRPQWWARVENRLWAIAFASGITPARMATLEIRGRKSGRLITFPVVIADYEGERYLVAMLGEPTNWVRNARAADGRATLRHGRREEVRLVEELSDKRGDPAQIPGAGAWGAPALPRRSPGTSGGVRAHHRQLSRLPYRLTVGGSRCTCVK
jgi:hypothetical protein